MQKQSHPETAERLADLEARGLDTGGTKQEQIQRLLVTVYKPLRRRLAAEQGDAVAQYNLAIMHRRGEGGPQNHAEARRLYGLAAQQGLVHQNIDNSHTTTNVVHNNVDVEVHNRAIALLQTHASQFGQYMQQQNMNAEEMQRLLYTHLMRERNPAVIHMMPPPGASEIVQYTGGGPPPPPPGAGAPAP